MTAISDLAGIYSFLNPEALENYGRYSSIRNLFYHDNGWNYKYPYFFEILSEKTLLPVTLLSHIKYYLKRNEHYKVILKDVLNPNLFISPVFYENGYWKIADKSSNNADILSYQNFVVCITASYKSLTIYVEIYKK